MGVKLKHIRKKGIKIAKRIKTENKGVGAVKKLFVAILIAVAIKR